ncbi:hypothetical protein IJ090_02940 [Candidatus Saccharibacteria bacterium]|nr:hypothetical protein [Candidatus Saccharibacteria bacterium]
MYSNVGLLRYAKSSGGKLVGTHQKLDKAARRSLANLLKRKAFFPTAKEIVHFEGNRGPDGLKRKSPGVDEPMHFILPDADDGKLWRYIENHMINLKKALQEIEDDPLKSYEEGTDVRAAFEAAWLAHAITDGLTPAHHFPYTEAVSELMTDQEYVKIFGQPIKGIMKGNNLAESAVKNWRYWGHNGIMSKHVAFEYGVALIVTAEGWDAIRPEITPEDLVGLDFKAEFYKSLHKIHSLDMYTRFRQDGWTPTLGKETKNILVPEIVRAVVLGWYACLPENSKRKIKKGK